MNDFSLSLLENIQLLLMSSSKETASELDTFFMEKLLLFYSSCTDKAIQEFLDVTEHDSVSINMAIDSVS